MGEKILVACCGNVLMGDDGVGVSLAALLEKELGGSCASVADSGLDGFSLIDFIEDYDLIYVVDAGNTDGPPGSVRALGEKEAESAGYKAGSGSHRLKAKEMIGYSRFLKSRNVFRFICVQPESMAPGALSDCLRDGLNGIALKIAGIIKNEIGGQNDQHRNAKKNEFFFGDFR